MTAKPDRGENNADETDPEVLGHQPQDDGLPGIAGYPPERPLGVEDPALLQGGSETADDLVIREWRESGPAEDDQVGIRLDPGSGNEPVDDSTGAAIADSASTTTTPSAEEAAVHIDPS